MAGNVMCNLAGTHGMVAVDAKSTGSGAPVNVVLEPHLHPDVFLVTGRDYVWIFLGTFGSMDTGGQSNADILQCSAEVMLTIAGQYTNDAARVSFGGTTQHMAQPRAGQPFVLMTRTTSYSPSTPPRLVGRINTRTANPSNVVGSFQVQAQCLVFDLTATASAGIPFFWDTRSGAPQALPWEPSPPSLMVSHAVPFHSADPEVLCFFTARVRAGLGIKPYAIRPRHFDGTTETELDAFGSAAHDFNAIVGQPFFDAQCIDQMGSWTVFTPTSSSILRLYAGNAYTFGGEQSSSLWFASAVFMLPLKAIRYELHQQSAASTTGFFGDLGVGGGAGRLTIANPNIGEQAGAPIQRYQLLGRATAIGLSGSATHGNLVGLLYNDWQWLESHPLAQQTSASSPLFQDGIGPPVHLCATLVPQRLNKIELIGFLALISQPNGLLGTRTRLLGFYARDEVPTPGGPVQPGPEIDLPVGRELLGVDSLSSPPSLPDMMQELEIVGVEAGSYVSESGYRMSWPLLLRPKRRVRLMWSALSATPAAALWDYLDAQRKQAFKLQMVNDSVERVFVIAGGTRERREVGYNRVASARVYAIAVEAVELVYTE